MRHRPSGLLWLGCLALYPAWAAAQPASAAAAAPLRQVTPVQFAQLRWLVGSWRGRESSGKYFYERYHLANDSTLQMTGYADSTFAKAKPGDSVRLRGGQVRYENVVATRLDPSGVAFATPSGNFGFTWVRTPSGWTATLRQTDASGRDRTTVYQMEPYKPPAAR